MIPSLQQTVTKPLISPREVRDGLLSFSLKFLSSYVLAENTRIAIHKTVILFTFVWVWTRACTPEGRIGLRVKLEVLHARGNFIFTLFTERAGSFETSVTTY